MEFVTATVLYPALVVALAIGSGLLIDRGLAGALPGVLVPIMGFGAMVVVAELCVYTEPTAPLTPYALVVVAAAGFFLGRKRLRSAHPDWWMVAAMAGVYLMTCAPVLFSGRVTLAGYLLDTTVAFHLAGGDYLIDHSRNFGGLLPSGYRGMLENYFGTRYPTGGHTVLGGTGRLVGLDLIWVYQPFMSLLLAFCTPSLYYLARSASLPRIMASATALLAAAPALVYAYAQMGAIKELTAMPFVFLLGAMLVTMPRLAALGPRGALAPALVAAAGFGAIGISFVPWVAATAAAGAVVLFATGKFRRRPELRLVAAWGAAFAVTLVLLALPTFGSLTQTIALANTLSTDNPAAVSDPGNLLRPLLPAQMAGVWLEGTHRVDPAGRVEETYFLIGIAAVAALMGLIFVVRRRLWALVGFVVALGIVWLALTKRGATWTDAKLLVITSPLVILLIGLGVEALRRSGRRVEAVAVGGLVAMGILVSNAFTYHDTNLAPTDRFRELLSIGERFAGDGPTLTPEFDEFAYYALPTMAAEGPGNAQRSERIARLSDSSLAAYGHSYDLDQLPPAAVQQYATIVARRRPDTSRPPSNFRLAWRGDFYDVWRRTRKLELLRYQPAGGGLQPASKLSCVTARILARRAEFEGAVLQYAPRPRLVALDPARGVRPAYWGAIGEGIGLAGQGRLDQGFRLPAGGPYRVWFKGDFSRAAKISIDGRPIGQVAYESGGEGNYATPLEISLPPGRHVLQFERGGGSLRPGVQSPSRLVAILFEPVRGVPAVSTIDPSRWRRLCAQPIDWAAVVKL